MAVLWLAVAAALVAVTTIAALVARRSFTRRRRLLAELGAAQLSARRLADRVEALEAVLDVHADGVIVVDRMCEVVFTSSEGRRYHGARYAEALAEDAVQDLLLRACSGEASQRDLALFGPPQRVLHIRAVPVDVAGEIAGAVAFVSDVTESRRVEDVRRDFVAAVSHELKTPIGALSLLAETIAGAQDAEVVSRLADRIGREADRLAQMVDDLLDLSVVESREVSRRTPVPVKVLVDDAIGEVMSKAESALVPVKRGPIDATVEITCDRSQVVSAIRNLLDNAVKYSDPGATVEVSVSCSDGALDIVVRDHGVGIPRPDLERIFERFYRVDKARSRDTGGTGLGLSIVRHVAQAHGGDVVVESVEGEGSEFRLRFPAPEIARTGPARAESGKHV